MMQVVLALTLIFLSVHCYADDQNILDFINEVKQNASKHIDPIDPGETYQSEDYRRQNLRSPFRKVETGTTVGPKSDLADTGGIIVQMPRPDASRAREYLERYRLSNFIMVGTLRKKGSTWGLVQDNTGMVHAIKIGDYIGENSGRVTKIDEDKVDVLETVPNGEGGWMELKSQIRMQSQEQRSEGDAEDNTGME